MSLILRPYQIEQSFQARKALNPHRSVLIHGNMGSGKTILGADIVIRAIAKGLTGVFLVDGDEILQQTADKFLKGGIEFQILTAKSKCIIPGYKVFLCMVETFYRRFSAGWFNGIDLHWMIADEVHVGNYNKVIDALDKKFPKIFRFGLTGTPVASSQNEPLKKRWNTIIIGKPRSWLIENGFLVPAIEIDYNKILEFKRQAGEFENQSVKLVWSANDMDKTMFSMWNYSASERQTIVYCSGIDHAHSVEKIFNLHGIVTRVVTSKTCETDRISFLKAYQAGICQVLINVGVYAKGFDSPQTSCIVLNMATMSLSKCEQIRARGGRPYPGKDNFIIIDMGNNSWRHGYYKDDIDWKIIFEDEERDKNFKLIKTVKLCPLCYTAYENFFVLNCTTCGNIFKQKPMISMENAMPENLRKPLHELSLKELYAYAKVKGYARGWAWNQFISRGINKQKQFSWK